jgi:CRISPR-associated exonuclease Cas4
MVHQAIPEPDYLPISMLNQIEYCERRFWLMYVCAEMEANAPLLEGALQHERVHSAGSEHDGQVLTYRRVYIWSDRLRIAGFADLVEVGAVREPPPATQERPAGTVREPPPAAHAHAVGAVREPPPAGALGEIPLRVVEYKHGRMGRWLNDHIQLCAQAMCIEERTGRQIAQGEIFYWGSRRRLQVALTPELRAQTEAAAARAFALLRAGQMPPPLERRAKCRDCSLEGICLPREVKMLAGE